MQIPQITFLRFLAAMGVVVMHFGKFTWPFSTEWLAPLVGEGALGVSFFFTLSGFLLAWVYARKDSIDWKGFALARIARVAPLYYIALFLCLLFWAAFEGKWPTPFYFTLQVLGLYAWLPDYSLTLNFPAWSVSVEFFLYASFPLLLRFFKGRTLRFIFISAGMLWLLGILLFAWMNGKTLVWLEDPFDLFLLRFPLWHLNAFVVGLAGGIYYLKHPEFLRSHQNLPAIVVAGCTLTFLAFCYIPNPLIGIADDGLFAPLFLLIIMGLAQDRGAMARVFSFPLFVFLGEISYAIYIFQAPCHQVFDFFVPDGGRQGVHGPWIYAYLLTLIGFSALIHIAVEKPLRNWIKGLSGAKHVAFVAESLEADQHGHGRNDQQ